MSVEILHGFAWGVDKHTIAENAGTTPPQVVSAVSTDPNKIQVTFDRDMLFHPINSRVLDVSSYAVVEQAVPSNVLTVIRVHKISDTVVELITTGQITTTYLVTVTKAQDSFSIPIAGNNTATFLGQDLVGPLPTNIYSLFGLEAGIQQEVNNTSIPFLQNQNPAPGAGGVSIETQVVLEVIDLDPGVNASSVIIRIDGTIAWQSGSVQNGFTGSSVPVTDGFRYTLKSPTDLPVGLITVQVYAEDSAGLPNVLDTSYSFTTVQPESLIRISTVFVVAQDLLRLDFTGSLAIESTYLDKNSYSIVALDDPDTVTIEDILQPEGHSSKTVFLKVRGLKLGKTYRITVTSTLFEINGRSLPQVTSTWKQRRTKLDSTIASMANMYNTRGRSNIRGLLEAIMISDETIGGDF